MFVTRQDCIMVEQKHTNMAESMLHFAN